MVAGFLIYVPKTWWRHQTKTFSAYWPFVRGIHRSPVNSPLKGQWRGALMFSLICPLTKRLSKPSWDWWFETPLRSLWRHCNDDIVCLCTPCHHENIMSWKRFRHYWHNVRGIRRWLLALCEVIHRWRVSHKGPGFWWFDGFFVVRLNQLSNTQSSCWCFICNGAYATSL